MFWRVSRGTDLSHGDIALAGSLKAVDHIRRECESHAVGAASTDNAPVRCLWTSSALAALLQPLFAMQKVVGSNPISRFRKDLHSQVFFVRGCWVAPAGVCNQLATGTEPSLDWRVPGRADGGNGRAGTASRGSPPRALQGPRRRRAPQPRARSVRNSARPGGAARSPRGPGQAPIRTHRSRTDLRT
jgi:hypothetical protein